MKVALGLLIVLCLVVVGWGYVNNETGVQMAGSLVGVLSCILFYEKGAKNE